MSAEIEITKLCYKHIRDDYWFGLYGTFNVIIKRSNGFINATKLCQDGHKQFYHWHENQIGRDMIHAFESHNSEPMLMVVTPGGDSIGKMVGGTYLHYKLIPHLASWISIDFAVKVSNLVTSYVMQVREEQVNMKLKKQMDAMKEAATVRLNDKQKEHELVLLQIAKKRHYMIRRQKRSMTRRINQLKDKNPTWVLAMREPYNPNSFNVLNKIKETLAIDSRYNYFTTDLPRRELIAKIRALMNGCSKTDQADCDVDASSAQDD